MSGRFRNLPIRRKLAVILLGSNTLALLTLFLAITGYQLFVFRSELAERFEVTAQMLATNSGAALVFGDARSAQEVLDALRAERNVVCARTLTPESRVLVQYGACPDLVAPAAAIARDELRFMQAHHDVTVPVILDGSPVGAVHVRFSLAAWHAQLRNFLILLGLTLALTVGVAGWLSTVFQRAIANPIADLVALMARVSGQRDYSQRATPVSRDEVGALMQGFNAMLGEVEERDARLRRQNEGLEAEVARRTAELSGARDAAEAAAHSLKRSEQHYRSMAEAMPIAVFTAGPGGERDYFNQTLLRYYGRAEAEMLKAGWTRFTHPQDVKLLTRAYQHALRTGQALEVTTRERRNDDSYRWHITRALPMRDESGAVIKWFGAMLDVEDMQHAREAAEASVRAKSEFLATMSHEIRTPLNSVIGMSDLLGATTLSPQQQQFVDAIRHSVGLLMAVINDVLDFSKIEAGQMSLENRSFNLHECLRASVSLVEPQAAKRGLEIRCQIEPGVPVHVSGDVTRVSQVLVNLLNNAVKFTQEGAVMLSAAAVAPHPSAAAGGATGALVSVAVSDSGIGMGAEQQARLFQPFSQGDATTTRRFGGTGLGLAICKRLADAMGGAISVTSTPGCGSTFTFSFPAPPAEESEDSGMRRNVAAALERATQQQPLQDSAAADDTAPDVVAPRFWRILLVEDNELNQIVATMMLRRLGCEAQIADNGRIGLDRVKAEHFDLILMDMQMPDLDGLEATRRIRAELAADRRQPYIIAMTANALQSDRERCLAAGMDDFLSKPVRLVDLSEALDRFAQVHRVRGSVRSKSSPG